MGTKGKLHAHGKTIKRLLDLLEIILGTLGVRLHGSFAWLPVGRANFAMLFYNVMLLSGMTLPPAHVVVGFVLCAPFFW